MSLQCVSSEAEAVTLSHSICQDSHQESKLEELE